MERSAAVEMLLAPLAVVATASVVDVSHNRHVECYKLWLDTSALVQLLVAKGEAGGGDSLDTMKPWQLPPTMLRLLLLLAIQVAVLLLARRSCA